MKNQEIRTVSYVHVGDKLVNTDDLDAEQKKRLATWAKTTYLNAMFQGRAVFWPAEGWSTEAAARFGEEAVT